jgi:hypothetical protein
MKSAIRQSAAVKYKSNLTINVRAVAAKAAPSVAWQGQGVRPGR